MSFELLGLFARRHRGHHELELAGAGGLQHQHHEDSLTGGAGSVFLAVKTTPAAPSQSHTYIGRSGQHKGNINININPMEAWDWSFPNVECQNLLAAVVVHDCVNQRISFFFTLYL